MNKIISIGYIGIKQCYLNISKEAAIERYCKSENLTREQFDDDMENNIEVIEFDDEFGAYSIYK